MSLCFTQVFASFVPVNSSLTIDHLLSHLQQVIAAEVHHDEFDVACAYGPFSDAFDYDVAFETLSEDDFQLADHCKLTLQSGSVVLEGASVENTDDHLTRWVAWVLFREFGSGDALSFSTVTEWGDGTGSRCFYEVHRDGIVRTKVFYSEPAEVY
jgi:hypothetical protein